jgi:hypothetical protein
LGVAKRVPLARGALVEAIVEEFNNIEDHILKSLVLSFKKRLEKVIVCNGKL